MKYEQVVIILSLLHLTYSQTIRVLRTTKDLSTLQPNIGGELHSSSLLGHQELTICARFSTFKFSTHLHDEKTQTVLRVGRIHLLSSYTMLPQQSSQGTIWENMIGNKWQNGNAVGYSNGDKNSIFTIWKMGENIWNNVCIIASSSRRTYKMILNGETVYEGNNYRGGLSTESSNLRFMGNFNEDPPPGSLFGQMTDINVWNTSFTNEDVLDWAQCTL